MQRPTDDELRALLSEIDHAAEMMVSTKRDSLVYSIVEELLAYRQSDPERMIQRLENETE